MSRPTTSSPAPEPYARRLLTELTDIHAAFLEILSASEIINVDPNRPGSGVLFIGHPTWGWAPSPDVLEADRMSLLRRVRDWEPRFRLLFPHPTPTVRGGWTQTSNFWIPGWSGKAASTTSRRP